MNNWLKFTLPGNYLFYSRLKRKSEQVSWLIVFPLIVFICIGYLIEPLVIPYAISFIIALSCWLNFYEIGYLENDAITISKEKSPTLRISESEIYFIQKNFLILILIKCLIGSILLLWLYYQIDNLDSILLFILAIIVSRISFYSHNSIRSRYNILTYHLLSVVKYWAIPFVFVNEVTVLLSLMLVLYLIFPLPRTIEHAVKAKYHIAWLKRIVGVLDSFRVKYYSVLVLVAVIFHMYFPSTFTHILLIGSAYFFTYRIFILLMLKGGKYKRTKFKAHDWEHK